MSLDDAGVENFRELTDLNNLINWLRSGMTYKKKPIDPMGFEHPIVLELMKQLSRNNVRYMIIGGIATVYHGFVQATGNLDLWVQDDLENKLRFVNSLRMVGIVDYPEYVYQDYIPGWTEFTMGEDGLVVHLTSYTHAFREELFDSVFERSISCLVKDIPIRIISLNDHLADKKKSVRPLDSYVIESLKKVNSMDSTLYD